MNSVSDDLQKGIFDFLNIHKRADWQYTIGKFLGLMVLGAGLTGVLVPFYLTIGNLEIVDPAFVYTGLLGLILNMSFYLSIGLFGSSLSEKPLIGALVSFLIIFSSWAMGWLGQIADSYYVVKFFKFLSVNDHLTVFLKGRISLSHLFFYLFGIAFFLYLTKQKLQLRRLLR
jgi:ABC-2 type transport system permease protein